MQPTASYVPLWVKSNHSFLEGASHPEELVETAHALQLPALAITDRDGVYGIVRAHMHAQPRGLKLLLGAQLHVAGEPLVVLAPSRRGYGRLCQLLSLGHTQGEKKQSRLSISQVCEHAQDLLVLSPASKLLAPLREAFDERLYALFPRHLHAQQHSLEQQRRAIAHDLGVKPVACQEVLYHAPQRGRLQDVLTCIRNNTCLAQAGTRLRINHEHYLKSAACMQQLFADVPTWLENTLEVAERCDFSLSQLTYRYPGETFADGQSVMDGLRSLTLEGARAHYGPDLSSAVQAQIERELQLICELEYGGYFVTMYQIVQFCRRNDILCQGRGSAANSLVCYCLGITAIDPIDMDLLFERFLSRERAEPPDIDLDIEHQRREEVIQWVYQRYDRRHAAMVANIVRFRQRSAIREVGKALGLPPRIIDGLAKVVWHTPASPAFDTDAAPPATTASPDAVSLAAYPHLEELTTAILDFPRHLSIHPGGFLLGHEPLDTLVPIERATMENRTVIQWDKQDIEDLGLFKVDLLGLGALTHIHRCFDLIHQHSQKKYSMATIPIGDTATYDAMSRGDTIGVFQIESRAQMSMLPRLRPAHFYDLVVQVAIVRPGPIQGDMVHPYLRRRENKEKPDYPHPSLRTILGKTYGVPIFQEQVMKIAIMTAQYTPGEADQLRRDMAAWRSAGRIEQHHERLIGRMVAQGIDAAFAERIFAQIRGFGEYGFPESHAASFACIAYVTAWLKCHHPAAFTCALLNAQPMGFYSASTIVEDAKRHRIAVLEIDINHSAWDCTLEKHDGALCVRMGMRYIQGIGEQERAQLAQAKPPFASLHDFVDRTQMSQKALQLLAQAGTFASLGLLRRDALWEVRSRKPLHHHRLPLPPAAKTYACQPLRQQEAVLWDHRVAHHSTHGHPMQSMRAELTDMRIPSAQAVLMLPAQARCHFVGVVICRQRPQTASGVSFFTLEDETGMVNLVIWTKIFEQHAVLAKTATVLGVTGKIQREAGVVHLIAHRLWAFKPATPMALLRSRNFQ